MTGSIPSGVTKLPHAKLKEQRAYHKEYMKRRKKTPKYDADKKRVYARRNEIREWYRRLKATLKCARCPENDSRCLDFHHLDSKTKTLDVSMMATHGYSIKVIEAEIAKCEVLCANCHRKETHN